MGARGPGVCIRGSAASHVRCWALPTRARASGCLRCSIGWRASASRCWSACRSSRCCFAVAGYIVTDYLWRMYVRCAWQRRRKRRAFGGRLTTRDHRTDTRHTGAKQRRSSPSATRCCRPLIERCGALTVGSRGDAFLRWRAPSSASRYRSWRRRSIWNRLAERLGARSPEPRCAASVRRRCGSAAFRPKRPHTSRTSRADSRAASSIASAGTTLDDEVLIVELTQVKGIGRWTAEMFLIFHLTRPGRAAARGYRAAARHAAALQPGTPATVARMRKLGRNLGAVALGGDVVLWRSLERCKRLDKASQVKRPDKATQMSVLSEA